MRRFLCSKEEAEKGAFRLSEGVWSSCKDILSFIKSHESLSEGVENLTDIMDRRLFDALLWKLIAELSICDITYNQCHDILIYGMTGISMDAGTERELLGNLVDVNAMYARPMAKAVDGLRKEGNIREFVTEISRLLTNYGFSQSNINIPSGSILNNLNESIGDLFVRHFVYRTKDIIKFKIEDDSDVKMYIAFPMSFSHDGHNHSEFFSREKSVRQIVRYIEEISV